MRYKKMLDESKSGKYTVIIYSGNDRPFDKYEERFKTIEDAFKYCRDQWHNNKNVAEMDIKYTNSKGPQVINRYISKEWSKEGGWKAG